MTVGRVHTRIQVALEIDFEVCEKVVAGDKAVRVRKPTRLRASAAQMAGGADLYNLFRIPRTFVAEQGNLRLGGVVLGEIAVAGETIKGKSSERVGLWINAGGVASGALFSED